MSRKKSFFESSNPVLSEKRFGNVNPRDLVGSEGAMTVSGAVNKTLILTAIMLFTALFGFANPSPMFMWGGALGGLAIVLWASFQPQRSPYLAPIYAALEGLFVGAVSAIYASMAGGIIFQAVTLTIALLFAMLFLYKSGLITVTAKFRAGVMMATGAVMLVYVLSFVLGMFGINLPFLHEGGMIGIGISLVIIGIASMNLLLDFDFIDKGANSNAPKYMEWFAAMGLLVTLVWLYLEILRLLSMLNRD